MNLFDKDHIAPVSSQMAGLRALLLVGVPGSGKGTQGRALGALPHFFHCSCGEVFRSIDAGSELGRKFREFSQAGKLMPNALAVNLWAGHIAGLCNSGKFNPATDYLVLDGIPRNLVQAQMMAGFIEVRQVFHLRCSSRQPLIDRIRGRALKENPPDDADESVINRRLEEDEIAAELLLKHYPAHTIHSLDALWPPHLVLKEILGRIIASEPAVDLC